PVHSGDSGKAHSPPPASLAGTYGTYSFDTTTGVWGYTLNQSLADPLTAGQVVHDHLIVTSADGTASYTIDVTITGSNDNATTTASTTDTTTARKPAATANTTLGDASAAGQLTVYDVDSGEAHFQTPASLAGSFGSYCFDPTTRLSFPTCRSSDLDPLTAGQVVHDHLIVTSADGTASYTIDVTITGSN